MLLGDFNGVLRNNGRLSIVPHTEMEQYLGRYAGLMLYLKEMDESAYAKICAVSLYNNSLWTYSDAAVGVLFCG